MLDKYIEHLTNSICAELSEIPHRIIVRGDAWYQCIKVFDRTTASCVRQLVFRETFINLCGYLPDSFYIHVSYADPELLSKCIGFLKSSP